jgi:hypothetical protein
MQLVKVWKEIGSPIKGPWITPAFSKACPSVIPKIYESHHLPVAKLLKIWWYAQYHL